MRKLLSFAVVLLLALSTLAAGKTLDAHNNVHITPAPAGPVIPPMQMTDMAGDILKGAGNAILSSANISSSSTKIIEKFCGYKFGSLPKNAKRLFEQKPKINKGWVVEEKLKKPFRKLKFAEVAYAESNRKLYSVSISSEPDFRMSDAEAEREYQAILDVLAEKYKSVGLGRFLSKMGNASNGFVVASGMLTRYQRIQVIAKREMFQNKNKLNKAGDKEKAWVFRITVSVDPSYFNKRDVKVSPTKVDASSGIDAL